MNDQEAAEQGETFDHDQQEMFQPPDINLGETRPRTPGAQHVPAPLSPDDERDQEGAGRRSLE